MTEEKPLQSFSNKEVEELLKLVTEKEEVVVQKESNGGIEVYDFRKPERVSKDQLHVMSMFYEGFARNLATDLSTLIRGIVESEIKITEQMIFSEFIASIPNPTCISLLSFGTQDRTAYLDLNYSILFPLIDRIIGGPGLVDSVPTRPLTEIEWELANSILSIIIENLNKSWATLKSMNFRIIKQDSNPFLIQPLQPNEPIIRMSILLKYKDYNGFLTIGHPYIFFEDVLPHFSTKVWLSSQKKTKESKEDIIFGLLSRAQLTVSVQLPKTSIKLKDFMELYIGSYIHLPQVTENDTVLYIEDTPVYRCKLGKTGNKYAVQILSPYKQK